MSKRNLKKCMGTQNKVKNFFENYTSVKLLDVTKNRYDNKNDIKFSYNGKNYGVQVKQHNASFIENWTSWENIEKIDNSFKIYLLYTLYIKLSYYQENYSKYIKKMEEKMQNLLNLDFKQQINPKQDYQ